MVCNMLRNGFSKWLNLMNIWNVRVYNVDRFRFTWQIILGGKTEGEEEKLYYREMKITE